MKPINTYVSRAGVAALLLLAGFVGSAQAAGTLSGTPINNTAKLDYSVNSVPQTQICSSPGGNNTNTCTNTTFVVDTKVNVNVVTTDSVAVSVTPGSNNTMTFTVTNTGNATQDLLLSTVNTVATGQTLLSVTDSFDPTSCSIANSSGVAIAGNRLTNVAPDTPVTIKVNCIIPALNGAAAFTPTDATLVALKATVYAISNGAIMAESGSPTLAGVDVALADGAGSDDASRDAAFSARSALKVAPASLNVTKSAAVLCDPFNLTTSPKAIPGAYVRYTVTIANGTASGTASAFMTTFTDPLDVSVNADMDLITGATKCDTAANGGVATSGTAGQGVRISFSSSTGNTRTSFGSPKFLTSSSFFSNGGLSPTTLSIPSASWNTLLPAENGNAIGELKPGDTLTLLFDAIVK